MNWIPEHRRSSVIEITWFWDSVSCLWFTASSCLSAPRCSAFLHISMGSSSHSRRFHRAQTYTAHLNSSTDAARPLYPPGWCWNTLSQHLYKQMGRHILSFMAGKSCDFMQVILKKGGVVYKEVPSPKLKVIFVWRCLRWECEYSIYVTGHTL